MNMNDKSTTLYINISSERIQSGIFGSSWTNARKNISNEKSKFIAYLLKALPNREN
jgi:hypothetical protein